MYVPKAGRSYSHLRSKYLVIAVLCTILLIQCRKDVYKQDPDFPDLPAYSEKGLNVGGCFVNDTPWLTQRVALFSFSPTRPLYIESYPNGDSVVLFFNGQFKEDSLQYRQPHSLFVVLKNIRISSDTALLQLSNRSFVLDGLVNYAGFANAFNLSMPRNAVGSITFGNCARQDHVIYGDGSPGNPKRNPYILAGRFDIDITMDRHYALTYGRFDLTVLKDARFF